MLAFRIKSTISRAVAASVDLSRFLRRQRGRYVLAYHRVLPRDLVEREFVDPALWITPETFRRQLEWASHVGRVVDLETLVEDTDPKEPLFAVTFDDGWKDTVEYAFPILRELGVPATVFVATGALDSGRLFWPEEMLRKTSEVVATGGLGAVAEALAKLTGGERGEPSSEGRVYRRVLRYIEALKEEPGTQREERVAEYYAAIGADPSPCLGSIMTWDDARTMRRYGIDFGSHTHTHAILAITDESTTLGELLTSKRRLEEELGIRVTTFSYPNARYKAEDPALVERAGYRYAFRIHNLRVRRGESPYLLPRFLVNESLCANGDYFTLRLLGTPGY